jgi:hypothetical protein
MISEKNPSIYYDRSTIGSSEELDEYGVWVKSEPQDLSSVNTDTRETAIPEEDFSPDLTGDLPDFEETETEAWLTEVSTDMTDPADFDIIPADDSDSLDDLGLFTDDLAFTSGDTAEEHAEFDVGAEEQTPAIEVTDAFGNDSFSGISMDDFLPKPEPEPENATPDPSPKVSEETGISGDISTQLLMRIAQELSSIKDELSSLKKELFQIKNTAVEPAEQSGGGGFFDEEDDEKIALTGDELNNILNTADFIEETGTDDEIPAEAVSFPDFPEQLSEFEEISLAGFEVEEDDLPAAGGVFTLPAENAEVPPELEQLMEKGVEPMTPAPEEDTSFLADDPIISDLPGNESFNSSFDFEDAVIEEPDLSGELQDNPIEEPSLENISLELDMELPSMEAEDLPDSGGDIEEIELSLNDPGESSESVSVELPDEISQDNDLLDDVDISLDDLIDISSADEAPEIVEDDNTYDQVIPEGFLVESEDSPAPEEILETNELLESAEDTLVLDDILKIEDVQDDASIEPDTVTGEIEDEAVPAEEEDGVTVDADFAEEETAGISLPDEADVEEADSAETNQAVDVSAIPPGIKNELRSVLSYMDHLLESLPEDKIEEFAKSEHFDLYKKLFEDLDLA